MWPTSADQQGAAPVQVRVDGVRQAVHGEAKRREKTIMRITDLLQTRHCRFWGNFCRAVYETTMTGTRTVLGQGTTKAESEAAAVAAIRAMVENIHKRAYFTSPSGHITLVVYYTSGWCYDIVRKGQQTCCCVAGDTFEECCARAKAHAAGYEEAE